MIKENYNADLSDAPEHLKLQSTFWMEYPAQNSFSTLDTDEEAEVVVVGGGIAGLSIAYNLIKAGISVVVVEAGTIGCGETCRTSAHLVTALDNRYYELEHLHGKNNAKLIGSSHAAAIDFIEKTVLLEGIDCGFKRLDGYLFTHSSDKVSSIHKEFHACNRAGLKVEKVLEMPGIKHVSGPSLKFSDQAVFHPMKYIDGLANALLSKGGRICTNTRAEKIDHTGIVTTDGIRINSKHVVVATNTPVINKYIPHIQQRAYRSYVIGATVMKGSVPDVLWWDTGDFDTQSKNPPYHYIRMEPLDEYYDLLIVGGEDHATGRQEVLDVDRYKRLEKWLRSHFDIEGVIYKWSGQVMEPMDSLAYIGRSPKDHKNMYYVTGDSGNGLTHATIGGLIISDLIQGKKNEWEHLYDPTRINTFLASKYFVKEAARAVIKYIKGKPISEKDSIGKIGHGEAKLAIIDDKRYGVYRDELDQFHCVGAECPHMKCTLTWNSNEKTWDCSCHGSRFTFEGKVVNGPANSNLAYHKKRLKNQDTLQTVS